MTAAAFPEQGGVDAKKLFVKRDDALLEESEGEIFGPASLFFSFRIVPSTRFPIQIFCKSFAIFFVFAEPRHILSMEEADDGTRGSARHQASKKLKIEGDNV